MALDPAAGMIALSAAITMAFAALATAWAEKAVGSAAVGAMAENPEFGLGKGMVMMVLPETIVVFGLIVALQLLGKMGTP